MNIKLSYTHFLRGECVPSGATERFDVYVPDGVSAAELCKRLRVNAIAEFERDPSTGREYIKGEWKSSGMLKDTQLYGLSGFVDGDAKGLKRLKAILERDMLWAGPAPK